MRAHTRPTMAGDGGSLCSVIFCVFVTKGISLGQGENGRWNGRSGVRGRKRITRRRRAGVLCNGHEPTFAFCSPKRVFCNHLLVLATQKSHHSRRVTHTHTLNALANTLRLVLGDWPYEQILDLGRVCVGRPRGVWGSLERRFVYIAAFTAAKETPPPSPGIPPCVRIVLYMGVCGRHLCLVLSPLAR